MENAVKDQEGWFFFSPSVYDLCDYYTKCLKKYTLHVFPYGRMINTEHRNCLKL